jgi:hypothetical protein
MLLVQAKPVEELSSSSKLSAFLPLRRFVDNAEVEVTPL